MALLEVRGLRAGYEGIPVVFGIDLDIEEGEIVAMLGSNGAGKTSTLRAVSGMIDVMAGEITFDGRRIDGMAAEKIARAGLLHVPEGRGIFPTLTVSDTLRLAGTMAGSESNERIDDALQVFPRLAERSTQTVGTLSGGEQQMVALARGLIARPKLLMVDEMSQGLAPTLVAELFERIEAFGERGVSVLLVEQFVGQALAVAKRAYVLEKGEISYGGPAAKLAKDEAFVRGSYLGDADVKAKQKGTARPAEQFSERVTITLPPALLRSLEERAEREGVPLGELIATAAAQPRPQRKQPRTRRKR